MVYKMAELYSLKSTETYLPDGIFLVNNVIDKYIQILVEYCNAVSKHKFVITSPNMFNFLILRGLETTTHVFKYVLLYTQNLEAAYHHAQKSVYYYLEFIAQVAEQKNAFLQLSSKDAITYVYKKTIYLINILESKKSKSDIINTINTYIQLYKNTADNVIITRKSTTGISADDVEKLKITIIQIKTEKKKTSEWAQYFKDLNIINE
jgi:hypothetical protein